MIKKQIFYIIENPLKEEKIRIFSPCNNFSNIYKYFSDIKDRKTLEYDKNMEKSIIMPYKLTFLHIFAYFGMTDFVKSSLLNDASMNSDYLGKTPLKLSLLGKHKNTIQAFLKFFIKNPGSNLFLGLSITFSDLLSINNFGFQGLERLYDSLLCKNIFSRLPTYCSENYSLPKFFVSENLLLKKFELLYFNENDGISVEFFVSAIRLNMTEGSQESIDFFHSILDCENQELFRSKFIQYYIDRK